MIEWPQSLVEELAARRAIIFLGAGASAGCTRVAAGTKQRPPEWKELLRILHGKLNRGDKEDRDHALNLLERNMLLDSAEVLRTCIHDADYSRFISETFKDYRPISLHTNVNRLDPKVLVTTNYDKVYENFCLTGEGASGYVVHKYYDEGLVARLRSPSRLLVKIHGCMDSPERTILTKSEYFTARQRYQAFFHVMESLFLTNTLLFVGYSLSDPDIQLLLENASITAASAHPHYAVMATGVHASIKQAFKRAYNVEVLEYSPDNGHAELTTSIESLTQLVLAYREIQVNE